MRLVSRHEAARLCHEGDEGRLPEQSRLSRHVRARDNDYLLLLCVETNVVGHIAFAHRQLCFDHGVSALYNVEGVVVGHLGAHIVVLGGRLSKGHEAVESGRDVGIDLYLWDILLHGRNELVEEACFENENFLVGTHNLLFIFFQLLRDVSLRVGQRLLAHPLGGHLVFIRVAHLKIIAKHVVVSHL